MIGRVPTEPVRLAAGDFVLRGNTDADVPAAVELFTDPATAQWYSGPSPASPDRVHRWCRRSADWTSGGHATWAVADSTDQMVGNLSIARIDTDQRSAIIAYRVLPSARGRGVATAAVRAATEWAFSELGIERMELVHAVDNPASCRVATKAGFLLEATQRAGFRDDTGRRWDAHLHARLSTDQPALPPG